MTQHSKFRKNHLKALKVSAYVTGGIFIGILLGNGCESDRIFQIRNEPLHQKYSILEDTCKDLVTKQQQMYSASEDQELRRQFSELTQIASNNLVKAESTKSPDVKLDYEVKVKSGLYNSIEKPMFAGLGIAFALTTLLGATYPLTMAGEAIYRRRKRNQ